jgi:NAD(P)-dependent dehydrogenase (short-subunit alcohol dehydrogenase family)
LANGRQVVLITGAAGGLGSALAAGFARRGAELLLLDRDVRGLDGLSDRLVAAGAAAPGLCPLDLGQAGQQQCEALVDLLRGEFGGLDHLLHCAAEFDALAPLDQVNAAGWMSAMQVNLNAAWLLTASCLPLLRNSGSASITFVLDHPDRSASAFWGAYGVAKAGLASLARIFAEELEGTGVRVNAINPGPMRTALRARAYLGEDPATQAEPRVAAERIVRTILGD